MRKDRIVLYIRIIYNYFELGEMITGSIRIIKPIVAIILVFSFLLCCVSCNLKDVNNKTISAESIWYEAEITDFKPEVNERKPIEGLNHVLSGADDHYIVIFSDGAYQVSDWNAALTYKDWSIKIVSIIDRTTKQLVKTINLLDVLQSHTFPWNVNYTNGKLYVYAESYDPNTGISMNQEFEIDLITENIITIRDISIAGEISSGRIQYSYNVGEYRLLPEKIYEDNDSYFVIRIIKPDGAMTEVELKDLNESIFDIPVILAFDENTALIPVAKSRDYSFYKLNLISDNLSIANKSDYSWLDVDQLSRFFNSPDGNVYITTSEGISKIDMYNKKYEKTLDFTWCGINSNYTKRLRVADYSGDNILLCGQYSSTNMFKSRFVEDFVIIELTKAAKNPHAGKTIIELYSYDGKIDGTIANAIIRFNETNSNYYIQLTDRYNKQDYISYDNISSYDDYSSAILKANLSLSYDLSMDIANGEGPDILINTSGLGQLNSENYLVDLSPYIQELDADKYFKNIIDGARTDSKLFQLPICFTIEGIQTDIANAGITGVGFTTGEYEEFLYDTLNGKDVIGLGQAQYFALLFNNMSDSFIKNGLVDLTGPEFSELAQFVKNNVQQNSTIWEDSNVDPNVLFDSDLATRNNKAYYCNCPGISGYFVKRARIKDGTAILGLPSSDGRGPMFGTKLSVAVSANAVNKDACIEFLKMMLTDEIQKELVLNDNFVINKEALRQGLIEAIDYFNSEEGQNNIFEYSLGTYVSINTKFTTKDIDNLEEVIQSCSTCDSVDAAINMIIIEEMPAYFLGQKDLDSVVTIIQDRAQKVLDERG